MANRRKEFILSVLESVKARSKDPSTKVACIAFDNLSSLRILATGYNGFAVGYKDDYERIPREEKYLLTVHAEINLVANASRNGIPLLGSTVVISEPPCPNCFSTLVNAGVIKVISPDFEDCKHYDRWSEQFFITKKIISTCENINWMKINEL